MPDAKSTLTFDGHGVGDDRASAAAAVASAIEDTGANLPMAAHGSDGASSNSSSSNGGVKASSMERQARGYTELAAYALLLVALDGGKQLSGYALKYYNGDVYPLSPTLIVGCAEILKAIATALYLGWSRQLCRVSLSLKFAVPAALYACTNNLHMLAFHFTTPAVWNILTQSRVIITAVLYRTLFRMQIAAIQWLALMLLTVGICVAQPLGREDGGGNETQDISIQPRIVALALFSSLLSAGAATFMEYTFKNDKRPFMEQQLQLSLFAALTSVVLVTIDRQFSSDGRLSTGSDDRLWQVSPATSGYVLVVLLVVCIALGAASGVVTGLVITRLDNVVKIYSQALCGVFNAVVCALAFPERFQLDQRYLSSLALVVISIVMYEKGGSWCSALPCQKWSRSFFTAK